MCVIAAWVVHGPQTRHRLSRELGGALQHLHLRCEVGGKLAELIQTDQIDGLFHEVHDVVEAAGEAVDVLAVERCDERAVGALDDPVRGLIGLVLGLTHLLAESCLVGVRVEHLRQQVCPGHEMSCHLGEQVVKRCLSWSNAKTHDELPSMLDRARPC